VGERRQPRQGRTTEAFLLRRETTEKVLHADAGTPLEVFPGQPGALSFFVHPGAHLSRYRVLADLIAGGRAEILPQQRQVSFAAHRMRADPIGKGLDRPFAEEVDRVADPLLA